MKNRKTKMGSFATTKLQAKMLRILAIIALVAVIGFSITACKGAGAESIAPPVPTSTVYESTAANGDIYILKITDSASSRAAYTPKIGDSYVLTVISSGNVMRSSGTVAVSDSSGIKLKPDNFETTFIVKTSNEKMTTITGTISVDNGDPISAPGNVTPTDPKTNDIKLLANDWRPDGQNWFSTGDIKFEDFTKVVPKLGWKLMFDISGTTDKQLNWFRIGLNSLNNGYKWYGSSDLVMLPKSFATTIEITIWREVPNDVGIADIWLEIANDLWSKKEDGTYWHNSGTVLDKPNGTLMATISNLKIQLAGVEVLE